MNDTYINKHLEQRFGAQDNLANFRIARTDNQYEYRLIGSVMTQARKYNYLPRGYWVIERLMPVTGANAEILGGIKFSYEPVYVFRNFHDNSPQEFNEEIVFAIVHSTLFRQESKTKRDWDAEELEFYDRQVTRALEFINDECSPMSIQLHFGEAVVKAEPKIEVKD